jgi:hypothetical protein
MVALWGLLVYLLLTYSKTIDFRVIFTLIASSVIIFVPIYKNRKKQD